MKWFLKILKPDAKKECYIYRAVGCSHVDSLLCNVKTCTLKANAVISPRGIMGKKK